MWPSMRSQKNNGAKVASVTTGTRYSQGQETHDVHSAQEALAPRRQDEHRFQLVRGEGSIELQVLPEQVQEVQHRCHLP